MRGATERAPDLSLDWCQSFRRRHSLTRLRTPNSDRPTDTPTDVALDNEWRRQPREILETPSEYGVPLEGKWPPQDVLCADETPLCYLPRSKTYLTRQKRRVYFPNDKRQITGTPVCALNGSVLLFQVCTMPDHVALIPFSADLAWFDRSVLSPGGA